MPRFDAAGVKLFALSYDKQDALAEFATAHEITYTLLSDPHTDIIRRFGILNTLIEPGDHPWYGLPFPGSYVIDADGIIVAKYFEHNLALRPGADMLLRAATGQVDELPARTGTGAEVEVDVSFDGRDLPTTVQRELVARFHVPRGQHLYAEPLPEGMVAAAIEVDDDIGILSGATWSPPTQSMKQATGETLQVYPNDVELRLSIAHNGTAANGRKQEPVTISGRVVWQACDDAQCNLPRSQRFEISVPTTHVVRPGHGRHGKVAEDFGKHFTRLTERHKSSD